MAPEPITIDHPTRCARGGGTLLRAVDARPIVVVAAANTRSIAKLMMVDVNEVVLPESQARRLISSAVFRDNFSVRILTLRLDSRQERGEDR
jgi:hypothetical protein